MRRPSHSCWKSSTTGKLKLGPEHPHSIESLRRLVNLYESWNNADEAAKWRALLLAEGRPVPGSQDAGGLRRPGSDELP